MPEGAHHVNCDDTLYQSMLFHGYTTIRRPFLEDRIEPECRPAAECDILRRWEVTQRVTNIASPLNGRLLPT